jgi:uncharacterized caspase-like protein
VVRKEDSNSSVSLVVGALSFVPRYLQALFWFIAAFLMAPIVSAEPRFALIIGNGNYSSAGMQLSNPINDAQAMNRALSDAGFETIVRTDVKRVDFYHLLRDFANKINKDKESIGLFYYAGHGIQADGSNYLIPVDAEIESVSDLDANAFDMDRVLRIMESAQNEMNIVILDACRDNPLPKVLRDMDRGLGRLLAPTGTFIGYATAPGKSAQDGVLGENGIFTSELVKAIALPGLPIELMFKKVIAAVRFDTGGRQVPWQESSVQGDFYFHPTALAGLADDPSQNLTNHGLLVPPTRGLSRLSGPVKASQPTTASRPVKASQPTTYSRPVTDVAATAPCLWTQPFPPNIAEMRYREPREHVNLADYQEALQLLTARMKSVEFEIDACKVILDYNTAAYGSQNDLAAVKTDAIAHLDGDLLVIRSVTDRIKKGLPSAEGSSRGSVKPLRAQADALLSAISISRNTLKGFRQEFEAN